MGYGRPRKCPVCGNRMTVQLTNAPHIGFICTHPHTVAMLEKFKADNRPHISIEGDNHEGTEGSNNDG